MLFNKLNSQETIFKFESDDTPTENSALPVESREETEKSNSHTSLSNPFHTGQPHKLHTTMHSPSILEEMASSWNQNSESNPTPSPPSLPRRLSALILPIPFATHDSSLSPRLSRTTLHSLCHSAGCRLAFVGESPHPPHPIPKPTKTNPATAQTRKAHPPNPKKNPSPNPNLSQRPLH